MSITALLVQFLALLEKMSVIVAAAFILSAARPFQQIVLGRRSWLRGVAIVAIFSLISIWGSHLGLEILGLQANNRAIGILVAGLLGGPVVGPLVGLFGGAYYAFVLQQDTLLAPFLVIASTVDGLLAGLWGARHRASQMRPLLALLVALGVQVSHLLVAGGLVLLLHGPKLLLPPAAHLGLIPELLENALGVALFVAIVRTSLLLRETEVALTRQQALAAQARLQALQAQIRPHFLFNALNTISYLVRTNQEQARSLLGRLAAMYRYLLKAADHPVPLAEELEQIKRYLEIEKARFGERLQVDYEIDDQVLEVRVPPLLLQPVVENSVKHGISPLPAGGRVRICARLESPSRLLLQVEDDGVGFTGSPLGTGLNNVLERIEVVGGGAGQLRFEGRPGRGTRVLIRLPLDCCPAAPGLADQDRPGVEPAADTRPTNEESVRHDSRWTGAAGRASECDHER